MDNNGYITLSDLKLACQRRDIPMSDVDCLALMTKLDPTKQGSVDVSEFTRAIAEQSPSFLDQLERVIVGVSREGGTAYKAYTDLATPSTSTKSDIPSGQRIVSVADAMKAKIDSIRPCSGRLDAFYHGLSVPKRSLPWADSTWHTVEAFPGNNPQYLTDRGRHTTMNRILGLYGHQDISVAHMADRYNKQAREDAVFHRLRTRAASLDRLAQQRERASDELDLRRIAFASANLVDYHDRVGGKVCHVV